MTHDSICCVQVYCRVRADCAAALAASAGMPNNTDGEVLAA